MNFIRQFADAGPAVIVVAAVSRTKVIIASRPQSDTPQTLTFHAQKRTLCSLDEEIKIITYSLDLYTGLQN